MKIFNTKYQAVRGVSSDNYIRTSLVNNQRLLPYEDFTSIVDSAEVYNEERQNCNKIRLIVTINPLCSNVLFNRITEVVYKEGSDECKLLNCTHKEDGSLLSIEDSIPIDSLICKSNAAFKRTSPQYGSVTLTRDTQLTRHDDYEYKCGVDIFNNHILRNLTFKSVCQDKNNNNYNFNTLFDTMREWNGSQVVGYATNSNARINLHLYLAEEVLSYDESVDANLSESNGWLGFINSGNILNYYNKNIGNKSSVEPMAINRVINNKPSCGFIDMCPSRDLWYFTPKYNKYRNRYEKNWNYCLTYPSKHENKNISFIDEKTKGLKIYYFDDEVIDGGINLCKIVSFCKHGLQNNDIVNLYFNMSDGTQIIKNNLSVARVYDDYSFSVRYSKQDWINNKRFYVWQTVSEFDDSISEMNKEDGIVYTWNSRDKRIVTDNKKNTYVAFNSDGKYKSNLDDSIKSVVFKQVVNSYEGEYYVRIFSKLPNWKFADTKINDYTNDNDKSILIKKYSGKEYNFDSVLGRAAFAKNAYGDDISQIIFTDDINLDGLVDNLGRPLTDIYLTIVKNNAGYREWYGKKNINQNITSDKVEFSHVFGKNSCAFELYPLAAGNADHQSIFQNNNISKTYSSQGLDIDIINERNSGGILDNDEIEFNSIEYTVDNISHKYDGDTNFYGDLCLYVPSLLAELTIDDVWFRFNTAQRELTPQDKTYEYMNYLTYDEILSDDYDALNFQVKTIPTPNATMANEGYKYKPHYKIPIKSLDVELKTAMPRIVTLKSLDFEENNTYSIITNSESYVEQGDEFILFNQLKGKYYTCDVTEVLSPTKFKFIYNSEKNENEEYPELFDNILVYSVIKRQETIPSSAILLKDGSMQYAWREVISNGFDSNSPNEVYPFTNGALYIEKSIRFFCKRQDPDGYMKMMSTSSNSTVNDVAPNKRNILDEDDYYNNEEITCIS